VAVLFGESVALTKCQSFALKFKISLAQSFNFAIAVTQSEYFSITESFTERKFKPVLFGKSLA
ncbi:MAG: hypothetical protein WC878_05705, partial [Candidatus Paceibacterota bacterium]